MMGCKQTLALHGGLHSNINYQDSKAFSTDTPKAAISQRPPCRSIFMQAIFFFSFGMKLLYNSTE